MKHSLRAIALPAALAATQILAACGSADTSGMSGMKPSASAAGGASAGTAKNDADV